MSRVNHYWILLKTYSYLSLIGILIAIVTASFVALLGHALNMVALVRSMYWYMLIPLLPLAGLLIVWLEQTFGHPSYKGLSLVIETMTPSQIVMSRAFLPILFVSTVLTHLFGGSAGRTGAAIQIGSAIGFIFSSYLNSIKEHQYSIKERQSLMVAGMVAGMSTLFQIPLLGICFVYELLLRQEIKQSDFVPAIVAAPVASYASQLFGLTVRHYPLEWRTPLTMTLLVALICLGVIYALVGNAFARGLLGLKAFLGHCMPNPYWRIVIFSIPLALFLFYTEGRYSGLGTPILADAMAGKEIGQFDWLMKLMITCVTMAIGYQGGEVSPLFAIGASLGLTVAPLTGLEEGLVVGLGYISVFAAATNTFLTPLVLCVTLFGWQTSPLFAITIAIAYFWNRRYSIYPNHLIPSQSKPFIFW